MARLGPYYALRRAPQSFKIIKASESLASLNRSNQEADWPKPGSGTQEGPPGFQPRGGAADAQRHPSQVPHFGLLSSESVEAEYPSGALPNGSLMSHPLLRGVASSESPQPQSPAGRPKRTSELPLPLLRPRGSRSACGGDGRGGCGTARVFSPASCSRGRGTYRRLTEARPRTPKGLGHPAGKLALVALWGGITRREDR